MALELVQTRVFRSYDVDQVRAAALPGRNPLLRQLLSRVTPMKVRNAALAVLVRVGLAIVVIEGEGGICAGVDAQSLKPLWLRRILDRRTERQDRPGADKQRNHNDRRV